jgi:hypothetical protein
MKIVVVSIETCRDEMVYTDSTMVCCETYGNVGKGRYHEAPARIPYWRHDVKEKNFKKV